MIGEHRGEESATQVDVLIVGAGPVGLALAGDLGWRGVSCFVVEKSDGSIEQPRMDLVGIRTMEFCRRWGIVSCVEDSPYPRDRPQDNVYVTSLTGYELGRESFPSLADTPPPAQSPQHRERCPQDMFDPILKRHTSRYPSVTMRYEMALEDLVARSGDVLARVRDVTTGKESDVSAKFVVGCDGASSRVRELLNMKLEGAGTLTYTTNVIFRCAELDSLHDKSDAYRWIFIGKEGTWATLVAINGVDRWRFSLIGDNRARVVSAHEIQEALRRAVGIDREYEILSVMPWVRLEGVATTYRQGTVFLAGDACHQMSPTGGFGMNTGIGDAVDLSWKLDAMLAGWGGPGLLDSYEIERQPVAFRNAREASGNLARMLQARQEPPPAEAWEPGERGEQARKAFGRRYAELMSREWNSIGIHLGYSYGHSPLCADDPDSTYHDSVADYEQTTASGSRAPHVWLPDGRSTLDWYGRGFVLVQTGGEGDLGSQIVLAALAKSIPLTVQQTSNNSVKEAYERNLVLVRPDGHVAWRSDEGLEAAEADALMDQVSGRGHGTAGIYSTSSEEVRV